MFLFARIPRTPWLRRGSAVAVVSTVALLAAACGSSSSATTSTTVAHVTVTSFSVPGPYAAGTARLTMADGDPVQVWYPVDKSAVKGKPTYTYTLKSWVPAALADNPLLSSLPNTVPTNSYLDAPIARDPAGSGDPTGRYPAVLFAHGYGSYPQQSTFLTDHLASWGFVVAAPLEPANDLATVLGGVKPAGLLTAGQALDEALGFLRTQQTAKGSLFHGLLDLSRIGVVGHSLGGGAAITMADNPAIKTYAALAPGQGTPPSTPKPGLVMYGSNDKVVPPASVQATYATLPTPKRLIVIDTAGHNVFDDICTIHSGNQRLVTILKAASGAQGGLGTFATLGTDGCFPPDVDPTLAYPLINQAVTAQLRDGLGIDPSGAGFGPAIDNAFPGVTAAYSADLG